MSEEKTVLLERNQNLEASLEDAFNLCESMKTDLDRLTQKNEQEVEIQTYNVRII